MLGHEPLRARVKMGGEDKVKEIFFLAASSESTTAEPGADS